MAPVPYSETSIDISFLHILQNVPFMDQKVIQLVLLLLVVFAAPGRLLSVNFFQGPRIVDILLPNIGD